jgi:1-acyl-sn-glycerol-3-phosphate acyltransferase
MRTCVFYLVFMPLTLVMTLLGIPIALTGADRMHSWARLWGRCGLFLGGARLVITGLEHVPPDQPVIFMPNHQSNFDILALLAGIPGQFRWLAKAELFRVPLFGMTMRHAGYIPVERSDRRKSMESMKTAAARIAEGTSVVIFPEGTRSDDGKLLEFKKGGFMMALQSGVQIVPMAIQGSYDILPKQRYRVRGGTIEVTFFPPLTTADRSIRQIGALIEEVKAPIAKSLGEAA